MTSPTAVRELSVRLPQSQEPLLPLPDQLAIPENFSWELRMAWISRANQARSICTAFSASLRKSICCQAVCTWASWASVTFVACSNSHVGVTAMLVMALRTKWEINKPSEALL